MKERIKVLVDSIIVESNINKKFDILDELFREVIPYALRDYKACREVVQFTFGQLERIPTECITFLFHKISEQLERIQVNRGVPQFLEYVNVKWEENNIETLLDRVGPLIGGEQRTFDLHPEIADALSNEERKVIASFVMDYIQVNGTKSQWTNDIFQNCFCFCNILYPICKKDGMVNIIFHAYGSIIDRLNTSGLSQDARDVAEGVLILGYNESCLAEAYFCASRAYTGANNVIAGLFFYYISLILIERKGHIDEKSAFDVFWQYLKICRSFGIYPREDINRVAKRFDSVISSPLDKLSFYHTLFTARLMAKEGLDTLVSDVEDFLAQNREAFFKNLEHGSMPWITLLESMNEILPNADLSGLQPYVAAARQVACREGNEIYFDLLEGKDLAKHLKVEQYKLQQTRSRSDYAMDNHTAMIIANKLLCQAYGKDNAEEYLMAMSVKTDFSMVLPIKEVNGIYKRFEITDVDSEELSTIYSNPKLVGELMALDEKDIIYWIGRGNDKFFIMSLFNGQFEMSGTIELSRTAVDMAVEKIISVLRYERVTKEPGKTVYQKSDFELEEEGRRLANSLSYFAVIVPDSSERLVFIKDLEIASYPHQLFVDREKGEFVSATRPCCNALSTEVFFRTNTTNVLPSKFSKAFWIPYGSEEFTFDMIYGKLEDVINKHGIAVQNELSVEKPLTADMTLLCAHGGCDISTSEVFYVNDQPILDTLPSIGRGKVAVLFICYSGTISRENYDNAMHTLVKKLIIMGYNSIVAPMWSLPTDIIAPWLSAFLDSMESGEYIIDAVFKANMTVKNEFVAPSAWACLHLFGNPYTRISDRERIIIE